MAAHRQSHRPLRRLAGGAAVLASTGLLLGLAGGCADAFTYSRTETAQGRTILSEGDNEGAALIFANQVRRNPRDYQAHYYLGLARKDGGRHSDAIRSFATGLEVMPLTHRGQNDEVYRNRLVDELSSELAEHDDGSLLAQFEQKAKGDPTRKLLVAMTHAKAGRPDEAIVAFNEARTLDRNNPEIAKQFGLYLESLKQTQFAEQELRRAYRLNTQDEEVAAALRRVGVIPGPAVLSATELSKPPVPLGPIPEVKWGQPKPGQAQAQSGAPGEATASPTPGKPAERGLN